MHFTKLSCVLHAQPIIFRNRRPISMFFCTSSSPFPIGPSSSWLTRLNMVYLSEGQVKLFQCSSFASFTLPISSLLSWVFSLLFSLFFVFVIYLLALPFLFITCLIVSFFRLAFFISFPIVHVFCTCSLYGPAYNFHIREGDFIIGKFQKV